MLLQAAVEYGALAGSGSAAMAALRSGPWWPWVPLLLLSLLGLWLLAGRGGMTRLLGLAAIAGAVYVALDAF